MINTTKMRLITWILIVIGATCAGISGAQALTTEQLLDELQERAFLYFWNEANPANGLVKDRSTPGSPSSTAATGFGLSAICIAIDHGWVTREVGRDRVLTTLQTFWNGPQGSGTSGYIGYKGLFYHFLDMNTATRTWTSELSTIDTALLFAGIIDAREYFSTGDSLDVEVRSLADSITARAEWDEFYNGIGIDLAWSPEAGSFGTWVGYNEAMILYILAIGHPTNPVPSYSWFSWTSGYNWATHYGQTYVTFPPLFGHQYSHCWVDFRGIQDIYMTNKGITYWENSRRATLAAREYCIANPLGWTGYGPNLWGLTASDDPGGYVAHGAPPAQSDNGTITPTAAASSIPFAPEVVIPALHEMLDTYGAQLWSTYGFKDAFNPTQNWYATDYLGIDQGPIIIMIENYRNQAVWNRCMQNADLQRGLARAGFTTVTAVDDPVAGTPPPQILLQNVPNPFRHASTITYHLARSGPVTLRLFDVQGREVATLVDEVQGEGPHQVALNGQGLSGGLYFYQLNANGEQVKKQCIHLP